MYLYRTLKGSEIVYVGYGRKSQRATVHPGASHNQALKSWLKQGRFQIEVAGPFGSEREAKEIEAALISAIDPRFNKISGDGPKFMPVGVPPELWSRPTKDPLTLREIGVKASGALLVYLSPGDELSDGRKKFDPVHPSDLDAAANIEKAWEIGPLIRKWNQQPTLRPRTVIGVHGPVSHRFIVGSLAIDRKRLGDPLLKEIERRAGRWEIPLRDRSQLDFRNLRGRRVQGVRFGAFSNRLHIWVDDEGQVRHPSNYPGGDYSLPSESE